MGTSLTLSLRSTPALVLFLALASAVLVMVQAAPPPPGTPDEGGESPLTPPETPDQPPADVNIPIIPDLPGIGIPGGGSGSGRRAKCERCKAGCHRKRGITKLICKGVCEVQCKLKISDEVFSCTQNCALSVSPTSFTDAYELNDHINFCYQSCKV